MWKRAAAVLFVLSAGACGSPATTPATTPAAPGAATSEAGSSRTSSPCDGMVASFDRIGATILAQMTANDPGMRQDVQYFIDATRTILVDECQAKRFSDEAIACFTAATDEDAWTACEETLPEETREAVQARIDAIPPPPAKNDGDRVALARDQVRRIAFEYFPQWAARPQHKGCPASPAELEPYVRESDKGWQEDPWGVGLTFSCTDGKMIVISAGPDEQTGTADDISSND